MILAMTKKKKRKRGNSGAREEIANYFKLEAAQTKLSLAEAKLRLAEAKTTSLKNNITRIKELLEDDDLEDEEREKCQSCIKKFQKQYDGLIMLEYLSTKF